MDWNPIYDKLLVKRDPPEREYAPGLVVADAHQKQQNVGTVLKIGDGRWVDGVLVPLTIKVGMKVLFSKFAGTELLSDQPDLVMLREDEILAWSYPVEEQKSEAA